MWLSTGLISCSRQLEFSQCGCLSLASLSKQARFLYYGPYDIGELAQWADRGRRFHIGYGGTRDWYPPNRESRAAGCRFVRLFDHILCLGRVPLYKFPSFLVCTLMAFRLVINCPPEKSHQRHRRETRLANANTGREKSAKVLDRTGMVYSTKRP